MLNLPVIYKNEFAVMSSVDLAELCVGTGKDAHSNFMKKAKKVLSDTLGKFSESMEIKSLDGVVTGKRTILLLPEREACLMAMSYSYELQARVYDAWQALKNERADRNVPKTYSAALLEAGRIALELEQAEQQLAIAAPKVEVYDKVIERETLLNATHVGQQVGLSGKAINKLLDEIGGVYSKSVKRGRAFRQSWIDAGNGEMKLTSTGHPQALFTAKGSVRVVELLTMEGLI